jgi:hypothetical protein
VRGEVGRGKRGTNRTCLRPWVAKWWTQAACRRWHRADCGCGWWWRCSGEEEGAGTGCAALGRGEEGGGRVVLGNVGAEWCIHARVTARRSWCWGGELRGLGWGFYRREREDGGLGTSRWGRPNQGAKPGAQLPRCRRRGSPWRQQRPR